MFENKEVLGTIVHWGVGGLLALAAVFFLIQFLVPAWRVRRQLALAIDRLSAIKASGPVLDLDQIEREVMSAPALQHCWSEFRDTLHAQKRANAMGMMEVVRWRQTAQANAFFTEQSLVDAPLRTEFYKHLPGILTGLGIIGTFTGLILGLSGFDVSDDAGKVRAGLKSLVDSVGGAFVVSGAAIFLAMLVTTVEKLMINGRYTQLERLCSVIDSLFDSGAGEEYLLRLVEASETSATQAMQMKESLVTDLKQVLTELTQQQIATMSATSSQLGETITGSLSEGLKEPLARISDAVQSVSGNQGDAVNKLLTDVLAGFTQQMETMFGGQMRGMNEMLGQTAATIQTASQRFEALAAQIQQAGTGAVEGMALRMDESLKQMQARQAEANEQMRAFIEQLKTSVAQGQSESADLAMGMMRELGDSTSALVKQLQQQSHAAGAEFSARQAAMARDTSELLGAQAEAVGGLSATVEAAAAAMREAVDRMKTATHENIDRMGMGAERLFQASNTLSSNLDEMRSASGGLSGSADKLNAASGVLGTALTATQQALGEQRAVRDALASMVQDLRATIETAKREGSMTAQLVQQLRAASETLGSAAGQADQYLASVSEVLGTAHAEFAKHMETTLREGNRAFHQELAQATGLLKGAIQDLGDVVDGIPQ
ncbi:anti-phage defense ZorAB system ZorA [Pelomonas sp. V22]|uniref:anti-phage ZorAB system protein ZorA n=1 Tax=Pelomonas sp. V22 TaxID=2822139 RepID=UPI0024A7CC9C|nr:anti-phage ZorAB system protein ZorA [Pelomonas sp. V22]MDI4634712.1 anti-phage defense ZorAB system ZorA [Pelomonas sp. V22]